MSSNGQHCRRRPAPQAGHPSGITWQSACFATAAGYMMLGTTAEVHVGKMAEMQAEMAFLNCKIA